MKYTIRVTKRFVKDAELCKRRGYDMLLLRDTMQLLAETERCQESIIHTS